MTEEEGLGELSPGAVDQGVREEEAVPLAERGEALDGKGEAGDVGENFEGKGLH